jgi:hypothetical protein
MTHLKIILSLLLPVMLCVVPAIAQDEEDDGNKPTRSHFESAWLIDNQSVLVPRKGTFEFMIQHRFGVVSNGITDLWGLYAPSNIRLGLAYTVSDNFGIGFLKGPLSIGLGTTKNNRIQDVSFKYGILQQTRNNRIPVSVTYYNNVGFETANKQEDLPNGNSSDRLSYFHQLIISRRFSPKLSIQVAPSLSHYNVVEPQMENDHLAVAVGGRFKFSAQSSFIVNVDQPITKHTLYNPQPSISFGLEVGTSAHTFQIFVTNFSSIIPQRNNFFNQNDPWSDGFLIGFNINRLWAF